MYEERNLAVRFLIVISQIIEDSTLLFDVFSLDLFIKLNSTVNKVNEMADADNRVILNVGGIRHETCKLRFLFLSNKKIERIALS